MPLNWLLNPTGASALPGLHCCLIRQRQRNRQLTAPPQPNFVTYYHKAMFFLSRCNEVVSAWSPQGRLAGSQTRTGHIYRGQIGSRCFRPSHPRLPARGGEGALTCSSLPLLGNPHFGAVPGPCGLGRLSLRCHKAGRGSTRTLK